MQNSLFLKSDVKNNTYSSLSLFRDQQKINIDIDVAVAVHLRESLEGD